MAIQLPLCHLILLAFQCTSVLGKIDFRNQSDSYHSKGHVETIGGQNVTIQQYDPYRYEYGRLDAGEIIGVTILAVGSIIVTGIFLGCCVYFCCPSIREKKVQRGYIIGFNAQQMPPMQKQVPTVQHMYHRVPYTLQNQTAPALQHIPPEQHISDFPPPYDTLAAEPQQQHSPMRQERQYHPVYQQIPTQPSVNPRIHPSASQPDPYIPAIRSLLNPEPKANEAGLKY